MNRMLLSGLTVALLSSGVFAAESRLLRSAVPKSLAPAVLGQANEIQLPPLLPVPDPLYSKSVQQTSSQYVTEPTTVVPMQGSPIVMAQPITLFSDVRYHATRNIAPCAVPTIIQVPDPCNKDSCCKTCVNVQICVPPCETACIKVTRDGNKVRYDFGKYAVVAKTVGNHVVVHYHD